MLRRCVRRNIIPQATIPLPKRQLATSTTPEPSVIPPSHDDPSTFGLLGRQNIREKLADWDKEHGREKIPSFSASMDSGPVTNTSQEKSVDEVVSMDGANLAAAMDDEMAHIRLSALVPGAMVEQGLAGQSNPILSVFVTKLGPYHLMCSSRGQLSLELAPFSAFTVKEFIDPALLTGLAKALPPNLMKEWHPSVLMDLPTAKLTALASPIVAALKSFNERVDSIYRSHSKEMDEVLARVAHDTEHTYRTLHDITAQVFDSKFLLHNGRFRPEALYAVHGSLLSGDFGAQALVPPSATYTNEYIYEIPPLSDVEEIRKVDTVVRDYITAKKDSAAGDQKYLSRLVRSTDLSKFTTKARLLIDASRKTRTFVGHGMPGPTTESQKPGVRGQKAQQDAVAERQTPEHLETLKDGEISWNETDLGILKVIEMWAGHEKFHMRSRLHMLGPTILRAVNRYTDFHLGQSVGWTFLKEVGWIPPWEIRSRYRSLPPAVSAVRGKGFSRPSDGLDLKQSLRPDFWAGKRKKWDIPAFAIDSESTQFIDDAISFEFGEKPNMFWVHVHVADPASRIRPNSPVAKHAEALPLTIWLPFHHTSMLSFDMVGDEFSLGPGRVCLTFSALISGRGRILETKVTPGVLGRVVYMTPEEANEASKAYHSRDSHQDKFAVGKEPPNRQTRNRTMTKAEELVPEDREILRNLKVMAKKRKMLGLTQGATPCWPAKTEVKAWMGGEIPSETVDEEGRIRFWSADPYIELRLRDSKRPNTEYSPIVHQAMLLGCEAGARWCAERSIPIPYLSNKVSEGSFRGVIQKLQEGIYKTLEEGKRPSREQWLEMVQMVGWQTVGTLPGRFVFHGQDMYAKVTSPLRRYSDLLCHWQIHGWLKEEWDTKDKERRQKEVDALGLGLEAVAEGDGVVPPWGKGGGLEETMGPPFSREQLDKEILPMMRVRERLITETMKHGNSEIALQALVRRWKFGENIPGTKELPKTFRMEVFHYSAARTLVMGTLDWFGVPCEFGREGIGGLVEGVEKGGPADGVVKTKQEEYDDDDDDADEEFSGATAGGAEEDDGWGLSQKEKDKAASPSQPSQALQERKELDAKLQQEVIKPLGQNVRFKDLAPGDVLEVELVDVDVAMRKVTVRPVKRVEVARDRGGEARRSVHYW